MHPNPYKDCCRSCKTGRADTCYHGLNCWCHRHENLRHANDFKA